MKCEKIICLGFFDSLHLGHRYILSNALKLADNKIENVIVSTFLDNFSEYIKSKVTGIYTLNERLDILNNLGYKNVLIFPTNEEFLGLSNEEFFEYILNFGFDTIVCGTDYTFGKFGKGNVNDLKHIAQQYGINVYTFDLVKNGKEKISTTLIKSLLENGEIIQANEMLGEEFFYSGIVTYGKQNGIKMGLRTANIEVDKHKIKIQKGVYATKTLIDSKEYFSITNVGNHPTFDDYGFNVETHIIDLNEDIYGKGIKVKFYTKIRDIEKFESIDRLVNQIQKDKNKTIEYFKGK
ncbi:MAG: riboflavin biosynthesis protein RibF [Clostridia bacterium]|nr:riboflavin biosynthesis protein RibF [Clostridia bacterium]